MQEYFVVDRIDNEYAVCEKEDRTFITLSLSELYPNVKEGDWILFENGCYIFDKDKTEEARNRNILLQNNLFNE